MAERSGNRRERRAKRAASFTMGAIALAVLSGACLALSGPGHRLGLLGTRWALGVFALAGVGGGGTNCGAPLALLNRRRALGNLVVYVSDNESWVDARAGRGTKTLEEWNVFRGRNPGARMACIDLQPNGTTQAAEREDILNIGGFSDAVFEVLAEFAAGRLNPAHWIGKIESVVL